MKKKPQPEAQTTTTLEVEGEALSSGWHILDIVTSWQGGFPAGSITLLTGPPNSGKTSICVNATADAIKRGWKVLYFDVESRLAANPKRLLDRGLTPEEIREKLIYYPAEFIVEKIAKIIRGEITSTQDYPRLVVIDSLSSLQTVKQFSIMQAGKWEDQSSHLVAALSRSIVECFKDIFSFYVPTKKIVMLLTAQVRANLQPAGVRATKPAVGYYVLHAVHTHINIFSYDTKKSEVDEKILGLPLEVKPPGMEPKPTLRTVLATVEKGQLSPAGSGITVKGLMFQTNIPEWGIVMGDFHNVYDLLKYGRSPLTSFLKRGQNGYITPSGKEITAQSLITDPKLRKEVLEECYPLLKEKVQNALLALHKSRRRSEATEDEEEMYGVEDEEEIVDVGEGG